MLGWIVQLGMPQKLQTKQETRRRRDSCVSRLGLADSSMLNG